MNVTSILVASLSPSKQGRISPFVSSVIALTSAHAA